MSTPLVESLEMTRNVQREIPVSAGDVAVVATAGRYPSYTCAAETIAPEFTWPTTASTAAESTNSCAIRLALAPSPSSSLNKICSGAPRRSGSALISSRASSIPLWFIAPYPCFHGPAAPNEMDEDSPRVHAARKTSRSNRFISDAGVESGGRVMRVRGWGEYDERT